MRNASTLVRLRLLRKDCGDRKGYEIALLQQEMKDVKQQLAETKY